MHVRLQKVIAQAGLAARRKAEGLIAAGRVTVNGEVVRVLGTKVDPERDEVRVDGNRLIERQPLAYFLFYKPAGVLTATEDARGIPAVGDYVKELGARVFPVGRLDYAAEGAVILTNDGELAHKLTHGHRAGARIYLAKVKGEPDDRTVMQLREGVRLEDGKAVPSEVRVEGRAEKNTWIKFVVEEGRRDLIRRMCAAVGHPAMRVFRPEFAGVRVDGLSPGEWRELTRDEIHHLKEVVAGRRDVVPTKSPAMPPRVHGRPNKPGADRRGSGRRAEVKRSRR
jgi:23S rRNA pseudouridine2605 synthase